MGALGDFFVKEPRRRLRAKRRASAKQARFASEAGASALSATAPLTTQAAINVARLGLTGSGLGDALSGAAGASAGATADRAATERLIRQAMRKFDFNREKAIRFLGVTEPGEIFRASESLSSLKTGLSGFSSGAPAFGLAEESADFLAPDARDAALQGLRPPPGLREPMRIR